MADDPPLTPPSQPKLAPLALDVQLMNSPLKKVHKQQARDFEAYVRQQIDRVDDADQQYSLMATFIKTLHAVGKNEFPDWPPPAEDDDQAVTEDSEESQYEGSDEEVQESEDDDGTEEDEGNNHQSDLSLLAVTLRPTPDVSLEVIESHRDQFFEALLALRPAVTRGRKTDKKKFTLQEATELTNLFFHEMMGLAALRRLNQLVTSYNQGDQGDHDVRLAQKAHLVAQDRNVCQPVRKMARTIERLETHGLPGHGVLASLLRNKLQLDLYNHYHDFLAEVQAGNSPIIDVLRDSGVLVPGKGKGKATAVMRYLESVFSITNSYLQNKLQHAQGLVNLIHHFGWGVLTILPVGTAKQLARYGTQRMKAVYPLLSELAPWLRPVCLVLETHVLGPIAAGRDLAITRLSLSQSDCPFIDRLTDAAQDLHGNVIETESGSDEGESHDQMDLK